MHHLYLKSKRFPPLAKVFHLQSLLTYVLAIISLIHIMLILLLQNLLTHLTAKYKHPLLTYFSIVGIKKV